MPGSCGKNATTSEITVDQEGSPTISSTGSFNLSPDDEIGKNAHPRSKTYRIPHTELIVSRMAYGCALLGIPANSLDFVETAVRLINTAYESGITFFDLADIYGNGNAEIAFGQILKRSPGLRDKLVIQSKCGERFGEGIGVDNSREYILQSAERSLKRLGTDYLDIFLLHFPDSLVEPIEVAQAFETLHRTGKVRYFGVSNHSPVQIELLKKYVHQPLVANQIQLGLAHWYVAPDPFRASLMHGDEGVVTLDYCRLTNIQVQAYSPLKMGNIANPPNFLNPEPGADDTIKRIAQTLADIAKKHAATPAAIMLAWLLRHPAQIVPIIGGNKPEHVVQNCVADRIHLSREDWYSLLQAAVEVQIRQNSLLR